MVNSAVSRVLTSIAVRSTYFLSFPLLFPHVAHSLDYMQTDYQEREAKLCTQESSLYLWCQSIMFQQLNLPAKVTIFNEISGAEPTALFQEEEITVTNP